jgi:hypothetical protein
MIDSDNEYGSPTTRFYFKITFCSRTVGSGAAKRISGVTSGLIKVVAPGKNKLATVKVQKKTSTSSPSAEHNFANVAAAASAATTRPGKQSVNKLMESFLNAVSSLNESMNRLDSRMQNIDMRVSHLESVYIALAANVHMHAPLPQNIPGTSQTQSMTTPMVEDDDSIKEEPFIDSNPFSSPRSQESVITEHCYSTRILSSPSKFLLSSQDEEFISLSQELANNVQPPSSLYESTAAFPKN